MDWRQSFEVTAEAGSPESNLEFIDKGLADEQQGQAFWEELGRRLTWVQQDIDVDEAFAMVRHFAEEEGHHYDFLQQLRPLIERHESHKTQGHD